MALELRPECERCGATTANEDTAFVCSYECTFCARCAGDVGSTCPNCGGELVRRPVRGAREVEQAATFRVSEAYAPRARAWCGVRDVHGFRLKTYAIARGGRP